MPTLRLEHPITDYAVWKAAFDRDPLGRARSGVVAHRIHRPLDDPSSIAVDLDFATRDEAERFHAALRELWASRVAAPALAGRPTVRLVEMVESRRYEGS